MYQHIRYWIFTVDKLLKKCLETKWTYEYPSDISKSNGIRNSPLSSVILFLIQFIYDYQKKSAGIICDSIELKEEESREEENKNNSLFINIYIY